MGLIPVIVEVLMTTAKWLRSRVRRQVSCTALQTSGVGDCSAEFNFLTPKAVVQRLIYPFSEAETLMLSCTSAPRPDCVKTQKRRYKCTNLNSLNASNSAFWIADSSFYTVCPVGSEPTRSSPLGVEPRYM